MTSMAPCWLQPNINVPPTMGPYLWEQPRTRTVSQKGKYLQNLGEKRIKSEVRNFEKMENRKHWIPIWAIWNTLGVEWCRSAQEPDRDRFNTLKQILSCRAQRLAMVSRSGRQHTIHTFYNTQPAYILSFHQPGHLFKWEAQEGFVDKRTRFLAKNWTFHLHCQIQVLHDGHNSFLWQNVHHQWSTDVLNTYKNRNYK